MDDLDDVVEPAPACLQAELHVPEHLPRLLGDVALADELPLGVERHDPGHEQQAARLDGVGVVAERLGHPLDAELLAMVTHPEKCAFSASKPPWKTSVAKNPSQWSIWSRSQSKVVHHSTKLWSPSVTGVTRIVAQ